MLGPSYQVSHISIGHLGIGAPNVYIGQKCQLYHINQILVPSAILASL